MYEASNTNNDADAEQGEYAEGDYGYDLAHEAMSGGTAGTEPEPPEEHPVGPGGPPPDDAGGDYGYDMAHDMGIA